MPFQIGKQGLPAYFRFSGALCKRCEIFPVFMHHLPDCLVHQRRHRYLAAGGAESQCLMYLRVEVNI